MRFMMLLIPGGYAEAKPGMVPDAADMAPMLAYTAELQRAGVLLSIDGLHPPSEGVRVRFHGGRTKVTDGPFAEAKEVVGGYWMIDVKSQQEAVEWARRCPAGDGDLIEIRQVHELVEFPADIQAEADPFPDLRAKLKAQRPSSSN
jgi:hypothetical protein